MRFSQLLGKTLRQVPSETDNISHQLLLRSGMIQQVASGVYSYLPLAHRSLTKIEQIIRNELDSIGAQEVTMPVLQPIEIWQKSGRDQAFGKSLFVLNDRKMRKLCLGPTHEEVVTQMVGYNLKSYRDLPMLIYQIQTKFRDEPRPRGGLLRVREFKMMDLYSFDIDEENLDISYKKLMKAYRNIYERCGLPAIMVEADSGAIGGKDSHEFILIAETGEDEVVYCESCNYAANAEKAISIKQKLVLEEMLPPEEVYTPGKKTIQEVAEFLNVPTNRTLKAVFYSADNKLIFVVIRGDLEVNEVKLKNILKCVDLRLATDEEVKGAGLVAGSASALGIKGIKIIADDSINTGYNYIVGANKPDYHVKNINYPRDFKVDIICDIALAQQGHLCVNCQKKLKSLRGIEVGHIFKLGIAFSENLDAYFLDREGTQKPAVMGCYGIGIGRLMAGAIEQNHDDKGILWPVSIAPYQVYLCALSMENTSVAVAAERLYDELNKARIEVLYDDRNESAGVKFNDADLLGIPLRVTVSARTLKSDCVEIKKRIDKESFTVPFGDAIIRLKKLLTPG